MNCRICDSPMYVEETVSNCLLGYITLQDSPHNIELQDLTIYYCPYCSHRQTENNLPANYYSAQKDGHDKFNGFKQYYGTLQQTEFKIAKLAQYGKYQKNFLDIGCGEGQTLEIAEKYFGNCVGVEPTHSDTKKENIINAYFDKDFKLDDYLPDQSATNNEYFSAFAAMQVFEHLEDVYSVLETAYSYLCEGGVGLINVPNGQLIYDNKFYHQVLGEHLNYFSPFSLALMAHKAGFDVIEIESINSTMELDLYCDGVN